MSNEDVEQLVAREDAPPQPPVGEVLDAQRDDAATGLVAETGPLDLVGPDHPAANAEEPALAELINNTGDDGGASSG
jgi:hypothetical protein